MAFLRRDKSKYPKNYRDPIWSILMSLVLPGWGHIYAGKLNCGIAFLLFNLSLNIIWIYAIRNPYTLMFTFGFYFAYRLIAAAHVWFVTRKKQDYTLHKYNRWFIYLLILIVGYVADFGLSEFSNNIASPHTVQVSGSSMIPTIHGEDIVVVDAAYYNSHEIHRGDLVNIIDVDSASYFIKRVIALPGETIEMKNASEIYINGKLLDEPYAVFDSSFIQAGNPLMKGLLYPPTVNVGTDSFFVMGDNRYGSFDSRHLGAIPRSSLSEKALYILLPLENTGYFK